MMSRRNRRSTSSVVIMASNTVHLLPATGSAFDIGQPFGHGAETANPSLMSLCTLWRSALLAGSVLWLRTRQ